MNAIFKRRSIRSYKPDQISDETIEAIIKAGMNAPSAGNERPWHFIIVKDRGLLDSVMAIHPYSSMLKQANVAILVCGDLSLEKYKGFWVQDCSAAIENMLLEITDRELGSVWLGIYPMEERVTGFRQLFNLPGQIIPLALIPVGVPAEEKPEKNEFDRSRIRYDRW